MPTPQVRPVIYVEDEESDAILLRRALIRIHSSLPLQILTDGQEAWEFLTGRGPTSQPPLPSLLLLDLKLPRMSGLELLTALKGHETLRRVPVIVMTSSTQREDVEQAFSLGADFYLVKRTDIRGTQELASAVDAYWIAVRDGAEVPGSDPTLHRLRRLSETLPVV